MSIAKGNSSASKMYLGSSEVSKIYKGTELVYGGGSGSRLPDGYTEVEYISSNGSSHVDLGIVQKSRNFVLEMKFRWIGSTASQFETFFGYMAASGSTPRSGFHKYTGKWMFGTNATKTTTVAVDNDVHVIRIEGKATGNKDYLYIDGTQITNASTSSTGLSGNTIPFYAFSRNRNGSTDNPASADIFYINYDVYSSSDYTTQTAGYEMVPCYNSSNVYGFYDIVNDEFHPLVTG